MDARQAYNALLAKLPTADRVLLNLVVVAGFPATGAMRPCALIPVEPPEALLMSMALRLDHGLGCPGYYDQLYGEGAHAQRLDSALSEMRKVYEEVSGAGFYSLDASKRYTDMLHGIRTAKPESAAAA